MTLKKKQRVLVLRAANQAQPLVDGLSRLGLDVIQNPMIHMIPIPSNLERLKEAFLKPFSMIIFTSVNGVGYFIQGLAHTSTSPRILSGKRLIAVGPKTEDALRAQGLSVESLPRSYSSKGVLELIGPDLTKEKVLIPTAQEARRLLPEELERRGADVTVLKLYKNILPDIHLAPVYDDDLVVFTSPSTADRFFNSKLYRGQKLIAFCIGDATEKCVEKYVSKNIYKSKAATVDSLIETIHVHLAKGSL